MSTVLWEPVPGYEGIYAVSDAGDIKGVGPTTAQRVLSPRPAPNGYLLVDLSKDGNRKTWMVHRIVANVFLGPCPADYQVNHINGHKTDNGVGNLEYMSASENAQHAHDNGLIRAGKNGKCCRVLTEDDVRLIFKLRAEGNSRRDIARRLNVSVETVRKADSRQTWANVHVDPNLERRVAEVNARKGWARVQSPPTTVKLKAADIPRIFALAADGLSQPAIGKLFGVSRSLIGSILRREQWVQVEIDPVVERQVQERRKHIPKRRNAKQD